MGSTLFIGPDFFKRNNNMVVFHFSFWLCISLCIYYVVESFDGLLDVFIN